jgi:hypothetical protein
VALRQAGIAKVNGSTGFIDKPSAAEGARVWP